MMKNEAKFDDEEDFEPTFEEDFSDNYKPTSSVGKSFADADAYFSGVKRRNKKDSEPVSLVSETDEEAETAPESAEKASDIELELKVVETKEPESAEEDDEKPAGEKAKKKPTKSKPSDKKILYTDDINNLAEFFKVYSDSTRLKIIHLLSIKEIAVSDIAEALDITQSATSHQLKILRTHRLVKSRKEAKQVFYSLDDNHIVEILNSGIMHMNEN